MTAIPTRPPGGAPRLFLHPPRAEAALAYGLAVTRPGAGDAARLFADAPR